MRISDWSSDVGSSDLAVNALHIAEASHLDLGQHSIWLQRPSTVKLSHLMAASYPDMRSLGEARFQFLSTGRLPEDEFGDEGSPKRRDVRSEEHTSELQSLMRISYAVFCLKKKKPS